MTPEEHERLVKLEVRQALMNETMNAMAEDVREVRDAVLNARGGVRTLLTASGVSAAVGGLLVKFAEYFTT